MGDRVTDRARGAVRVRTGRFALALALGGLACAGSRDADLGRPVIVELKLIDAVCTSPPDGACLDEIQRVRERVLAQLEGTEFRVTGSYRNIPFVALRVDAAGYTRLRESGWVRSIREDDLRLPLPAGTR